MKKEKLVKEQRSKLISVLIISLLFSGTFFIQSCGEKPLSEKYTIIQAKVYAESQVKERLKSPSSASFNWNADDYITKVNDTTFIVKGYVDSQNSFGAELRSNYSCKIVYLDKLNMVRCEDLVIE